jgi:hypothetical protein
MEASSSIRKELSCQAMHQRDMPSVPAQTQSVDAITTPHDPMHGVTYGSSPVQASSPTTIKRKAIPASVACTTSSATTSPHDRSTKCARPLPVAPAPTCTPSTPARGGIRRSSSPLKHEFRPGTSSESDHDDEYFDSETSCSSESSYDDFPLSPLDQWKPLHSQLSPSAYTASVTGSLAPSDSASQMPPNFSHQSEDAAQEKTFASVFCWSNKGNWESVHGDECLIVVTPGLIEAFDVASTYKWSIDQCSPSKSGVRPIIALELTPLVPLRRGTALDISIRSPPTATSTFQEGSNIMFRSRNGQECATLYGMINQARINNPTYVAIQNARAPLGGSNWSAYMDKRPGARNLSSWWRFGSKKSSYRQTETDRSPSSQQTGEGSGSVSNAMSAWKRMSSRGSKSTATSGAGMSKSGSSEYTTSDGALSPPLPHRAQGALTGITNKRIRLYLKESASKWRDMGSARLTVLHAKQPAIITSSGHLVQEKRLLVTGKNGGHVLIDVTLGETSFERVARTGIAVSIVEDLMGSDGMRVAVGSTGGVGGNKAKVYMIQVSDGLLVARSDLLTLIQMQTEAETAYTFSLVGRLRY